MGANHSFADVARVELGAVVSYGQFSQFNGLRRRVGWQSTNSLEATRSNRQAGEGETRRPFKSFPAGLKYSVPLDNTKFVAESVSLRFIKLSSKPACWCFW